MAKKETWEKVEFGDERGARQGLTGPVVNTIDSSTNEPTSNYLRNARKLDPRAGAHASTVYAVANLSVQGPILMRITGHGAPGIIVTGTGQDTVDDRTYMSPKSEPFWGPVIARLRGRASMMELWACHTGADQKGALFLSQVANALGAQVRGLTGNVSADPDGMHFEPGCQWQTARPGQPPPPPIAPPSLRLSQMPLKLAHDGREMVFDDDAIRQAIFEPAQASEAFDRLDGPLDVTTAARSGLGEPLNLPGELAALVTGRLTLAMKAPDGREIQKTFAVFNDRLLRDEAARDVYYRPSEAFIAAIQGKAD